MVSEPVIVDAQQITDLFDIDYIMEQLMHMDYETMKGLTPEQEGTVEQWVELAEEYPEMYRLLMVGKEIAGYWNIVCLDDGHFERMKNGNMRDSDITHATAQPLSGKGRYNGYFLSINLLPSFRTSKNLMLLMDSFFEQLEIYANRGIYFSRWCANAYTREGRAMCKFIGLSYACDNISGGEIYYAESAGMLEGQLLARYPGLLKLYKEEFK
ncbi:MAG: hypothetical protein FWE91_01835 [Defluviitaleaceae bacterium]|nr:hypothetical protein [Defluviitaleaceae bacterium]MCL2835892.1 hypothetical protein [Defluviitaleaceae bacterium]